MYCLRSNLWGGHGTESRQTTTQHQKAATRQHRNSHSHSCLLFPSHASSVSVEVVYISQNSQPGQKVKRGKYDLTEHTP